MQFCVQLFGCKLRDPGDGQLLDWSEERIVPSTVRVWDVSWLVSVCTMDHQMDSLIGLPVHRMFYPPTPLTWKPLSSWVTRRSTLRYQWSGALIWYLRVHVFRMSSEWAGFLCIERRQCGIWSWCSLRALLWSSPYLEPTRGMVHTHVPQIDVAEEKVLSAVGRFRADKGWIEIFCIHFFINDRVSHECILVMYLWVWINEWTDICLYCRGVHRGSEVWSGDTYGGQHPLSTGWPVRAPRVRRTHTH